MIKILISGRVQGVGFRAFVQRRARLLGLKGYVRNLDDGRVEVVASGSEPQIRQLIEACRMGPLGAEVKGFETETISGDIPEGFFVRH